MSRRRNLVVGLGCVAVGIAAAGCGNKASEAPPAAATVTATPAPAGAPALNKNFGNVKVSTSSASETVSLASSGISIAEVLAKNPDPQTVIATVNGAPVRRGQVYAAYQMYRRTLQARGQTFSPQQDESLQATTFRMVVADELLNQAASSAGINPSPAEVDKALADVRSRMGTPAEWAQFLKESHLTEKTLREQVERNIRTDAYRSALVANRQVTEAQAKDFYDRNRETFKTPEQIHAQLILLPVNETTPPAEKDEAKRRAEEAHKRAVAGEDFGALARQYSQDPSAQRGGDIGFVPRGVMFPQSEEIAFALEVGKISPVFETPKGFTVFKVLERKPAGVPTFEEVKPSLMLDMGRLVARNAVEEKVRELSATAQIVVLDPKASGGTANPVAVK